MHSSHRVRDQGVEIKNASHIPISITLASVQKRDGKRDGLVETSIPANEVLSTKLNGCAKYITIAKDDKNRDVFWEGIIPTCTDKSIVIDAHNCIVMHNNNVMPNLVRSSLTSFISMHAFILSIVSLIIVGIYLYRRKKWKYKMLCMRKSQQAGTFILYTCIIGT